jgi:NTE family protein
LSGKKSLKSDFSKSHSGAANKKATLGIALQGGGSYGAFTKGVLRALLESKEFNKHHIQAVTGTSAGAVNGALLVYGLNMKGPKEAIKVMDSFWDSLGNDSKMGASLLPIFNSASGTSWPNIPKMALALGRSMLPSGYLTSLLKSKLNSFIKDWKPVKQGSVKLFVNATKVDPQTKERSQVVFSGTDLNADTVAASGALEEFGAHTIDGIDYFDGAYWRNPCFSDIKKEKITDLLTITIQAHPEKIIHAAHQDKLRTKLNKPGREALTSEIHNHLAFLEKNSALNIHTISLHVAPEWDETSRINSDPLWLKKLDKLGYQAGKDWLKTNGKHLGIKSSYHTPCFKKPDNPCNCNN